MSMVARSKMDRGSSRRAMLRTRGKGSGCVASGTEGEDMEPNLEMPTMGAIGPARAKPRVKSGGSTCA